MDSQKPLVNEVAAENAVPGAGWLMPLRRWFDAEASDHPGPEDKRIDWPRVVSFTILHLGCLGIIWVGISPVAVGIAAALYALRMFAITGFYHRYFSHRAFKTHRVTQFIFALLGNTALQRGPLWWSSQHRHHHRHSDTPEDSHSPRQRGLLHSHMGWFMTRGGFHTRTEQIPDLLKYKELRLLDRFNNIVVVAYALGLYGLGVWLNWLWPGLGTSGMQILVWGFFVSTVFLFHASVTINSLAHRFGNRRYDTNDDSRNNALLALITFGEGWHNNHHFYPGSARQGFHWWEVDITWYGLKLLEACGLIWDLKKVPDTLRRTAAVRP